VRVLAVVAHPDDELIGCGATLRKLAIEGHEVFACVLCAGAEARHDRPTSTRLAQITRAAHDRIGIKSSVQYEFKNIEFNAVPHLEIVQAIESAIERFRPEWIFAHHPGDLNIDHRVAYETTMSAVRLPQRLSRNLPTTLIRRVFLIEIASSTDWGTVVDEPFVPNSYFDVENTFDDKLAALDLFEGALKPFPHSRSKENLRHLAYVRGGQAGVTLAEAFCLVRDVNL